MAAEGKGLRHLTSFILALVVVIMIVIASVYGRQLQALLSPGIERGIAAAIGAIALVLPSFCPNKAARVWIYAGTTAVIALVAAMMVAGTFAPAEVSHIVLFGALGAILSPMRPLPAILILGFLGMADEVLQAQLPDRVATVIDVAMNYVSSALGYVAGQSCRGPLLRRSLD